MLYRFQYSIGDAENKICRYADGLSTNFFQYSIGDAKVLAKAYVLNVKHPECFQYSIGDANIGQAAPTSKSMKAFNTPLEMLETRRPASPRRLAPFAFNTPLEMLVG